MLTWLDWYVRGATKKIPLDQRLDDLEATRLMVLASLANRDRGNTDPDYAALHCFQSALLPFVMSDEAFDSPEIGQLGLPGHALHAFSNGRGLRPTEDLVQALLGGAPGSEVRAAAMETAMEYTWYIDLPHRTLLLNDKTQIRAIFVQPTRAQDLMLVVVLTAPGANAMQGRYAWILGDRSPDAMLGSAASATDEPEMRRIVEDFVLLLLAYRAHSSDLIHEPLPQYTMDALRRLPKKRQKALRNQASLFSVSEIRPPAGRFGKRRSEDTGAGWTLQHRVAVKGHFRWQPHGPGRKLKKLIWIAPHERGKGRKKPVLEKI